MQENLSGARVIRAYTQENAEIAAFDTSNQEYIQRSLKLVRLMGMLWPSLEAMLGLAVVMVLWLGGREVLLHRMSVGQFIAFNTYMIQLTWPIIALGWVINIFQRGTASMGRINEILAAQPEIKETAVTADALAQPIEGEIEFRDLNFSYNGVPVLHDINLRIPAGSSLAIVGPTGSGKTTLVSLIPRIYDAPAGSLLLDERSIREYPLARLRRNIGFVPQETFLFSDTVRNNIAFGTEHADKDDVHSAAEAANIAADIEAFPEQYDTMVGERGITLSGGQKQRSAIARAIRFGPTTELAGGFAANPNLFRAHWIIGLPDSPMKLTRGSRIKMRVTQTQNVNDKPAHVRRTRLSASSDWCWSELIRDQEYRSNLTRLSTLTRQLKKIPSVETPVMAEQPDYEKRETMEFERGNFLTKIGPALTPDVPGLFPRLPANAPRNRLTLAKWFFSPEQPLTARTAVNRYWEQLFGTGMVETLENFGSMGETPTHPELLDWLALHFENELHWDMKALLRELVTSATYRQSAKSTPILTHKDPLNRLLARAPQQRLSAEMVRDQALIASGLLSDTMGGPPVMPPQPEGVWNSVYNDSKWIDAKGPNRYRRAIYTYIKRTSGYPSFLIFDASDHDVSLARRISTNTPLQALVTMNDPVYQEASEALADRMLKAADKTDDRLRYGARMVLSRDPTDFELAKLRELFEKALVESGAGMVKRAAYGNAASGNEKRALTAVASVLFNLDAALTR